MAKVDSSDPSFVKRDFDNALNDYQNAVAKYRANPQGYIERQNLERSENLIFKKIDPSFSSINKSFNEKPTEFEQQDRERLAGYYKTALEKYKANPDNIDVRDSLKKIRDVIKVRQNSFF